MTHIGEKKLVLVVDDAPANLHAVHSILKNDFKIRGAKALELVMVKPQPDLILLDVEHTKRTHINMCVYDSRSEANEALKLDRNHNVRAGAAAFREGARANLRGFFRRFVAEETEKQTARSCRAWEFSRSRAQENGIRKAKI